MRAGLLQGRAKAAAEQAEAVITLGAGQMFSAGAEMNEFDRPCLPPSLAEVLAAIERFPGIVVAALHGAALGGGLELALACHARLATTGTRLGLPEVKRGLLPGAGGTQRLLRLIGPEAAARIILSGEPISAEEARDLGLIDVLLEGKLIATALARTQEHLHYPFLLARDHEVKTPSLPIDAFEGLVKSLLQRWRGQESPRAYAEPCAPL